MQAAADPNCWRGRLLLILPQRRDARRCRLRAPLNSGAEPTGSVRDVEAGQLTRMTAARPDVRPTEALSRFAAGLRYQDLPAEVAAHTKLSVLDTIGIALAGSGLGEGCDEVVAFAAAQSEGGRATLWSSGIRVGASQAALANAVHARALDYDDIIEHPQIHVAVCVVPAALAVSELIDSPVSGRAFLAAVAAGCEVQSRLAAATAAHAGSGLPRMLSTQVFGYFSAAAACGNLLGLDAQDMASAFGLALMQAAGTEEMVVHAAASAGKCLYAGLSNQGGVNSALMARYGVLARGEPFAGEAGLFAAYYDDRYDRDKLTDGLGDGFVSLDRCFKTMPGTLVSHAFVEAALSLMASHGLTAGDIDRVRLHVGPWGSVMCEPGEMRRRPPSASAAMNSIPFSVAKAIVHGKVGLADFGQKGRSDPAALAMASRIEHRLDPRLGNPKGLEPGVVEMQARAGDTCSLRVDRPRGHPSRPVEFADVAAKFRENARHAARPLEAWRIEAIIDRVLNLDDEPDVRSLASLIANRDPSS
jgi:2-methylcitrate dehydratase PrpD